MIKKDKFKHLRSMWKKNGRIIGLPYYTYIKSPAWAAKREDYFQRNKRQCAACFRKERVTLHHREYSRLGRERDSDLVPLCWGCHQEFHELHGGNLHKTYEFITEKNEELEMRELAKRIL